MAYKDHCTEKHKTLPKHNINNQLVVLNKATNTSSLLLKFQNNRCDVWYLSVDALNRLTFIVLVLDFFNRFVWFFYKSFCLWKYWPISLSLLTGSLSRCGESRMAKQGKLASCDQRRERLTLWERPWGWRRSCGGAFVLCSTFNDFADAGRYK